MKSTSFRRAIGLAAAAYACFGTYATIARAAGTDCRPFGVNYVLGSEYAIRNNAWGAADGQQCISWQDNGDFSVASNTRTDFLAYPDILKGAAYGITTSNSGLPIQVSSVWSMPVTWNVGGTNNAPPNWNASWEAWAWTGYPPGYAGQADGTEVMVWLSAAPGNSPGGGLASIGTVAIGGVVWNVYASRWDDSLLWNYIAYFPVGGATVSRISTDFKAFLDDAKIRTGSPGAPRGPCQNGTAGAGYCLYNNWYLSSLQAGFELFGNGGTGLSSSGYSAKINTAVSEQDFGQIATGVSGGGKMALFSATVTDLGIRDSYQTTAGPSGAWTYDSSQLGGLAKRLAVISTYDGRLDVYHIGTDNGIYHSRELSPGSNTWTGWQLLNGGYGYEIALQRNDQGMVEVVVIGTDNRIYHNRELTNNGSWTGWSLVDPNGHTAKHIALSKTYENDALQLVYTGLDNNLYQSWQVDQYNYNWHAERAIGGQAVQLALTWNFDSTLTLAYVGMDSNIYYKSTQSGYIDAPWGSDTWLGGTSAKQVVFQQAYSSAWELFYVGTNSAIYHRQKTNLTGSGSWSAETQLVNGPAIQLATTHNSYWGLEVFYSDPNGAVYRVSQSQPNGSWGSPTRFSSVTAAIP